MSKLIDYAINHARLTVATLIFLLCAGMVAYVTIPKEAEPDVRVPIIYVQLSQRGISPEDSERLLLRPVETQLKSVGNVKEMRSTAFEGGGFVPINVIEDEQTLMWVGGVADGTRVIVQGQDFVREGQHVEAVPATEYSASR